MSDVISELQAAQHTIANLDGPPPISVVVEWRQVMRRAEEELKRLRSSPGGIWQDGEWHPLAR